MQFIDTIASSVAWGVRKLLPDQPDPGDEFTDNIMKVHADASHAAAVWSTEAYYNDPPNGWKFISTGVDVQAIVGYGNVGSSDEEGETGTTGLVVAFRGTDSATDVIQAAEFYKDTDTGFNGRIHSGFLECFKTSIEDISSAADAALAKASDPPRILVTGHSLGGAVATLFATHWKKKNPDSNVTLITLGSPRVGDEAFCKDVDTTLEKHYRWVYESDVTTTMPPESLWYAHSGYMHYASSSGVLYAAKKKDAAVGLLLRFTDWLDGVASEGITDAVGDHGLGNYVTVLANHTVKASASGEPPPPKDKASAPPQDN